MINSSLWIVPLELPVAACSGISVYIFLVSEDFICDSIGNMSCRGLFTLNQYFFYQYYNEHSFPSESCYNFYEMNYEQLYLPTYPQLKQQFIYPSQEKVVYLGPRMMTKK